MKKSGEERAIYITHSDLSRLEELLEKVHESNPRDSGHLAELEAEMLRAEVVESREIPPDVITMNSKVRLKDLDTGREMVYTLVFPASADAARNRISILAPVGTALIGYRVGDVIAWKVPSGMRKLQVEEVIYQPEAAGDYDR
ncbi:MAG: nucleoside diphosphate kinase regulator [Thermodesulfovibrionales bacterium]